MAKKLLRIIVCIILVISVITMSFGSVAAYNDMTSVSPLYNVYIVFSDDAPDIDELLKEFNIHHINVFLSEDIFNDNTFESYTGCIYCVVPEKDYPSTAFDIASFLSESPYVLYLKTTSYDVFSLDVSSNERLQGDADGDGVLTIADATCVQRYLAGITKVINYKQANVSKTGTLNIRDATLIQMRLAKIVNYYFI